MVAMDNIACKLGRKAVYLAFFIPSVLKNKQCGGRGKKKRERERQDAATFILIFLNPCSSNHTSWVLRI